VNGIEHRAHGVPEYTGGTEMAKKKQAKKKGKGKAKKPATAKSGKKKAPPAELAALKAAAKGAQAGLAKAKSEAEALRKKAAEVESKAKDAYRVAVAPYREACRKAGVECEFAGARASNVAPAMRFLVEKVKGGVKVMVKGKPETEEVIPFKTFYVESCGYVAAFSSSAGESRRAA